MQIDLKERLSILTSIEKSAVDRLLDKSSICICDAIDKAFDSGEQQVIIDIGFGSIIIELFENSVKYKFRPSEELEQSIINTITTGENELINELEKSLVNKITNIYKSLL